MLFKKIIINESFKPDKINSSNAPNEKTKEELMLKIEEERKKLDILHYIKTRNSYKQLEI